MLHPTTRPPSDRLFVLGAKFFDLWVREHWLFNHLQTEDVFEIFLSEDWESQLWRVGLRALNFVEDAPNTIESTKLLPQFNAVRLPLYQSYRDFLKPTVENAIACSLTGQEVVCEYRLSNDTLVFRIKPCQTLPIYNACTTSLT